MNYKTVDTKQKNWQLNFEAFMVQRSTKTAHDGF